MWEAQGAKSVLFHPRHSADHAELSAVCLLCMHKKIQMSHFVILRVASQGITGTVLEQNWRLCGLGMVFVWLHGEQTCCLGCRGSCFIHIFGRNWFMLYRIYHHQPWLFWFWAGGHRFVSGQRDKLAVTLSQYKSFFQAYFSNKLASAPGTFHICLFIFVLPTCFPSVFKHCTSRILSAIMLKGRTIFFLWSITFDFNTV